MKISIITTTYNREHKLKKTVQSVLAQNYNNWEYHIIDDGSEDNSSEYLNTFNKLSNFYIYNLPYNSGQPNALYSSNVFNKITGDLVILLDSDDCLLNNSFSTIINDFKSYNTSKILSINYEITEDPNIKDVILLNNSSKYSSSELLKDNHPLHINANGFRDYLCVYKREYWIRRNKYFISPNHWYVSKYDMNINFDFEEVYSDSILLFMHLDNDSVTKGANFKKYAPISLFTRKYIYENYSKKMDKKLLQYTFFSLLMTSLTFANNKKYVTKLIFNNLKFFFSDLKKMIIVCFLLILPSLFNYKLKYLIKTKRLKRQ
jgi:glycosyltransferase involved in cell wall biosynthesis